MDKFGIMRFVLCLAALSAVIARSGEAAPDFDTAIAPILARNCISCHCPEDTNGELVLETYKALMKGGETGAVVVPGNSSGSLLVKMIESKTKKVMPPGKKKKLDSTEIATIHKWIDSGAHAPANPENVIAAVKVPVEIRKIAPKVPPTNRIFNLSAAPGAKLVAIGRYGEVELRDSESLKLLRKIGGLHGNVNALAFSADGKVLATGSGDNAVAGEAKLFNTQDGSLLKAFEGHRDAIYSVALSPDGKTLATGSYDQSIVLWNTLTGEKIRALSGHNGAVFALAFRHDGKVLASASGDRTVKLWDPATGNRLDTLSQSLKEVYTLAFSPDGTRLASGGVDSRIRVWRISPSGLDGTNEILYSIFAHEGAILRLTYSPDGGTLLTAAEDNMVKVWNAGNVTQKIAFETQPDWAEGIAYAGERVIIGRLNGTLALYDPATGKPPKTEILSVEPRGIQRGASTLVKLAGRNLFNVTGLKSQDSRISADVLPASSASELIVKVTAAADAPLEKFELTVESTAGESVKVQLFPDDFPQASANTTDANAPLHVILPVGVWGEAPMPGAVRKFTFDAAAGHTIICEVEAKRIGSKATPSISLIDSQGNKLAGERVSAPNEDPVVAFPIQADGCYSAQVTDAMLGGSKEHFYRVRIGSFAYVTGIFPLSAAVGSSVDVKLSGYNLPADAKVRVDAKTPGELALPLDRAQFRMRTELKLLASTVPELIEHEPNDTPAQAQSLPVPGAVCGTISLKPDGTPDSDYFKFEAKTGQNLIIETAAAQRGSPIDTRLDVFDADGKPVLRMMLQATRDSYINFRGIDSGSAGVRLKNWEEMELNEYLYLQGEVCRLFRMPQGPDGDMLLYSAAGRRKCYFDTTPSAHANEETCYIVEPLPRDAKIVPNGLPAYPLYYSNDDDCERKLGTDSRIHFTAPAGGTYLVRVSDTRGFGGERFAYRLLVREAHPDFNVTLSGENPTVPAGSGIAFTLNAERIDGFDGDIRIDVTDVPAGFTVSTPLVIQAGHNEAKGTINARPNAVQPSEKIPPITLNATAMVDGNAFTKKVNALGKPKLGAKPKLLVRLEPSLSGQAVASSAPQKTAAGAASQPSSATPGEKPPMTSPLPAPTTPEHPLEITIAPGQSVPAWLRVERNGFDELVTFTVDNLPHGVIVDNIGLSGVAIEKGLGERQIFLAAAKWVPEQDRYCYAIENQAGKQTSPPVLLHVRKAK